jgi:hypothetical protein
LREQPIAGSWRQDLDVEDVVPVLAEQAGADVEHLREGE